MIKGKTADEIRKTFNIKNDFTPAEEEQVRPLDIGSEVELLHILRLLLPPHVYYLNEKVNFLTVNLFYFIISGAKGKRMVRREMKHVH